jgi:hypothetical protein
MTYSNCSCSSKTLRLQFDKRDFLNSFTTTGVIGNSNGFLGNAIVTAQDSLGKNYRIFFNVSSIDEQPDSNLIRNNITMSVSSVSKLEKNLITTTFNTIVYKSNYDNVPGIYTSDNGSKFIVPDNGNQRQLVLRLSN